MTMPLEIISHNVNGYDRNKDFIRETCCSYPMAVYGMQEHWLRPPSKKYPGVNVLKTLDSTLDGWGKSAMKTSMENRVLRGRPFGGTGFLWSKNISSNVRPRTEYYHERVTVLQINTNRGPVIIINCYLPFFNVNDIVSQTNIFADTIGFIDYVIKDNPDSSTILMGDMNCQFYNGSNQFSLLLRDLINEHGLYCTYDSMDSFDASKMYTRSNIKQGSFSLLDYILISSDLVPFVVDTIIINSGDVLSDHLPVKLSLDIGLTVEHVTTKSLPSVINWRGLDENLRKCYENVMEECLDSIKVPYIVHGRHCCNDTDHIGKIENYYNEIVKCIKIADFQLPRCKPTMSKGYWNDELSSLKNDSIVAHEYWKLNGCPRTGPIFETKKKA